MQSKFAICNKKLYSERGKANIFCSTSDPVHCRVPLKLVKCCGARTPLAGRPGHTIGIQIPPDLKPHGKVHLLEPRSVK